MPPVNTPLVASPSMKPQQRSPPLSPSSPTIPRSSTHPTTAAPREPTPPPLAYLSSPVPDLASTLSTTAAQEADEANVRFLRESLSSLEETAAAAAPGANAMRGTHVDSARDPRTQSQQSQGSGSGDTPEDLSRRERLQRVLARLNRLHDPPTAPGMSSSGAYSNRTPPPEERQSIYDWAPGGAEYHEADRERRDGELDAILRELREQRQEDSARRHQRQSSGTPAPGSNGGGEDGVLAAERRDRLRERERRRRENEWISLRTRAAIQRSRGGIANGSSGGEANPASPSSVSTERMLRYVTERERSGMSEEEERARGAGWFRPTPRSAIESAAESSMSASVERSMSEMTASRDGREGWMLPPPASSSGGHASAEALERQERMDMERQERVEAFRRGYLAENVPPRLPRISTPTVPPSVAAPTTTSSSSTAFLENALKYLSDLRGSYQYEDALSTAIDHGLATKEFFADKHDDFIMDLESMEPLADSSWMQPGTVFDGHQHATNTSCTTFTRRGAPRASERESNITHVVEHINPNYARLGWASAAGGGFDHPPGSTRVGPPRPFDPSRPWLSHQFTPPQTYPSASYTSVSKHIPDPQHDHWPVRVILHAIDTDAMTVQGTMEAYDVPQHPANLNVLNPGAERPKAGRRDAPITTYLEGHIIDLRTHSFLTPTPSINRKGGSVERSQSRCGGELVFPAAIPQTDAQNWLKLPPFSTLSAGSSQSMSDECARLLLSQARMSELFQEYIFMRWKERCFVHSKNDRCSSTPEERHGDQDRGHGLTISGFYYVSLRRSDGAVEGLYFDPTSTPYQHLRLQGSVSGWPAYGFR